MKTQGPMLATTFFVLLICITGTTAQKSSGTRPTSAVTSEAHHHSRTESGARDDTALQNVKLIVPAVILMVIVIAIVIGVVYILYRVRYGAFCCISPKMRFRVLQSEEGDFQSGSSSNQTPFTPPPAYDSTHMEHPPDYQDALQDVILSTGCSNLPYYSAQELIVPEYEPPHVQDSTVSHDHEQAEPERVTQEVDTGNECEGTREGDTQSTSDSMLDHCDESTPLTV